MAEVAEADDGDLELGGFVEAVGDSGFVVEGLGGVEGEDFDAAAAAAVGVRRTERAARGRRRKRRRRERKASYIRVVLSCG